MQIIYEKENIALLQIHDDETPTLTYGFVEKLTAAVNELNKNKQLKVVILKGNEKYFSSGADKNLLDNIINRGSVLHTFTSYVAQIPSLITSIHVPTIAAMQGHAIGGGLAMGLWCDFILMGEESLYGANFMKLGFTPGMGSTTILPHIFGYYLAAEMLFSGNLFKGAEIRLANKSLKNYIAPNKYVYQQAYDLAIELANSPAETICLLKNNLIKYKQCLLKTTIANELDMHKTLKPLVALN